MGAPREIELKRGLRDQAAWDRLCSALGTPRHEAQQRNLFVDSEDGVLREAGLALRLRLEPQGGSLTVKGAARRLGELSDRLELEAAIDLPTAQALATDLELLRTLDVEPLRHVRDRLGARPLVEVVRFDNLRRSYAFDAVGLALQLEVDRTCFPDGSVDHEVEVELGDAAQAEAVSRALHALLDAHGVAHQPQPLSKFARALARR